MRRTEGTDKVLLRLPADDITGVDVYLVFIHYIIFFSSLKNKVFSLQPMRKRWHDTETYGIPKV